MKKDNKNENYELGKKLNASIAVTFQLVLINQGLDKNQDLYSLLNSCSKITSWKSLLALKDIVFFCLNCLWL